MASSGKLRPDRLSLRQRPWRRGRGARGSCHGEEAEELLAPPGSDHQRLPCSAPPVAHMAPDSPTRSTITVCHCTCKGHPWDPTFLHEPASGNYPPLRGPGSACRHDIDSLHLNADLDQVCRHQALRSSATPVCNRLMA